VNQREQVAADCSNFLAANAAGFTVSRATRLSRRLIKNSSLKNFTNHIILNFKSFSLLCFNQYGHHQVFKIIVEETAMLLLSWLWLLTYGPLYAHAYSK
jgi:hypothetical protein